MPVVPNVDISVKDMATNTLCGCENGVCVLCGLHGDCMLSLIS